jgi:tRNA pseudouridine55 synthase
VNAPAPPSGILVVDKPEGPTSHDVVGWARRALGTRVVGHAGTLDPFASGVLVVLVGEATKLSQYATEDDKRYRAELALGQETDTLDREGRVVDEAPVPPLESAQVEATLRTFVGTHLQVPPAYSALKQDGVALHTRARRGEEVCAPAREVTLHGAALEAFAPHRFGLSLHTGKGFYVRSLGRDLARALHTRGHLSALRRTASGRYRIDDALAGDTLRRASRGDGVAQTEVRGRLLPILPSTVPLPTLPVDEPEARALGQGKRPARSVADGTYLAFLADRPVAIVEARGGVLRVRRGFR